MLTGFAIDNGLSRQIIQRLPEAEALGLPHEIEARLFDLWIVREALIRRAYGLSDEHIQSLIDGFHWESYRQFMAQGLSTRDLKELQARLRDRYTQYSEALTPVLRGGTKPPLTFARTVARNLFDRETRDPVVAIRLVGSVTAALFSISDALKDVLPRTDFR